jgi:hypothetical protein
LKNRFGLRGFDDIGTAIHHPPMILSSSLLPHVSPEQKFGMPSTATFSLSEVLQIRGNHPSDISRFKQKARSVTNETPILCREFNMAGEPKAF